VSRGAQRRGGQPTREPLEGKGTHRGAEPQAAAAVSPAGSACAQCDATASVAYALLPLSAPRKLALCLEWADAGCSCHRLQGAPGAYMASPSCHSSLLSTPWWWQWRLYAHIHAYAWARMCTHPCLEACFPPLTQLHVRGRAAMCAAAHLGAPPTCVALPHPAPTHRAACGTCRMPRRCTWTTTCGAPTCRRPSWSHQPASGSWNSRCGQTPRSCPGWPSWTTRCWCARHELPDLEWGASLCRLHRHELPDLVWGASLCRLHRHELPDLVWGASLCRLHRDELPDLEWGASPVGCIGTRIRWRGTSTKGVPPEVQAGRQLEDGKQGTRNVTTGSRTNGSPFPQPPPP